MGAPAVRIVGKGGVVVGLEGVLGDPAEAEGVVRSLEEVCQDVVGRIVMLRTWVGKELRELGCGERDVWARCDGYV